MQKLIDKVIQISFYLLFFLIPLIFYPWSSELFEFNKMVLTYALTVILTGAWLIKSILNKHFIFKRSKLDAALLAFLITEGVSTLISIDVRTSLLGYYSRFHGGLVSSICYALLYWIFVATMNWDTVKQAFRYLFISAVIVAVYGIFEHFGHSASCLIVTHTFTVDCWIQDVKMRVFATLGQPNWLAAWTDALIPLALAQVTTTAVTKRKGFWNNTFTWTIISGLLFAVLFYTKSRSGLLGLATALGIFTAGFIYLLFQQQITIKKVLSAMIIPIVIFILMIIYEGTAFTPGLVQILTKKPAAAEQIKPQAPALEADRFDTGRIRTIVWKGALGIWRAYPILGTGVETFAYSYYQYRPVEHNLVSEWDFLYNKAHNEYLNFLATTGTIGTLAYLFLIGLMLLQMGKNCTKSVSPHLTEQITSIGLLSGYVSILVTNFFGFSVVPVAILFFLFPAFAITLNEDKKVCTLPSISGLQKTAAVFIFGIIFYFIYLIGRYWYADYLYGTGKANSDAGNLGLGQNLLTQAVKISPNESTFWDELAQTTADIAVALNNKEKEQGNRYGQMAIAESQKAVSLSPANVNLKRDEASIFFKLVIYDPNYLINARSVLAETIQQAPTEAKLWYNYGLSLIRTGDTDKGLQVIRKTINMKPDYREARLALALVESDQGNKDEAKFQLEYILTKINPNDDQAKAELEKLNSEK